VSTRLSGRSERSFSFCSCVWSFLITLRYDLAAETGVITYSKKGMEGKPIFQCHPVERPFRKSSVSPVSFLLLPQIRNRILST
jgi:hypothetical protein